MSKRLWQSVVLVSLLFIVGGLLTASLMRSLNPIVVGVREGSKFQSDTAASIVARLKEDSYASETMTISVGQGQGRSAGSSGSPVDIEITGYPLTARDYPDLVSLGVIIELPILLVVHADGTDITNPRDLKGKRIEVGVEGTTIASVAEQILANYGVTATNSTFRHASDEDALTAFAANQADAILFYFNPGLGQFGRLADTGDFQILDLPENIALAGQIGTVVPTTVPRGAFSVEHSRPDRNIPTVAVPVTVVANKSIRDGAAYAIVQALNTQFSRGTVLAPPGTFPKFDGTLPIHAAALQYASTGSIPWQYEALPGFIAEQWTALLVLGSILLLIATIYSVFFPDVYGLWTGILRPKFDRMDRDTLQAALQSGKELSPRQRARLMKLLDDTAKTS